MKYTTILLFLLSVAVCTLAAHHRFRDSAHALGMLKIGGSTARHPALLKGDLDSHVLIATAGVVPPYRGNARVVLQGDRDLEATFHNAEPAVNLGIHRRPEFRGDTYHDLRPGDRIALWVKIRRKARPEGKGGAKDARAPDQAVPAPEVPPGVEVAGEENVRGTSRAVTLAFYDTATSGKLLTIPLLFTGREGGGHGH